MKRGPASRAGWSWIAVPHAVMPRARARGRSLAAMLVAAALIGCMDSAERPNALAPDDMRALILRDSAGPRPIEVPIRLGGASATVAADSVILVTRTPAIAWGEVSGGPGILLPTVAVGYTQQQTAVGVFSGGVQMVNVRTWEGNGVLQCSGTYGTLIGYDSSGVEVARQDLSLIEPEDCSPPECPDGVTWGAEATITVSGPNYIKRVELTLMSPLEFQQNECAGGNPFTNHAGSRYFITWEGAPPPPCPPTGEPELDNPLVRELIFSALDAALLDPNKIEPSGGIYQDTTDGTWLAHRGPSTGNTPCASGYQAVIGGNNVLRFFWHGHTLTPPMTTTAACAGYPVGTTVARGPSGCANLQNPPNPCDFSAAFLSGKPHYIIDKDYLYRIQPNATNHNTGNYEKRWRVDRSKRCFGPRV